MYFQQLISLLMSMKNDSLIVVLSLIVKNIFFLLF